MRTFPFNYLVSRPIFTIGDVHGKHLAFKRVLLQAARYIKQFDALIIFLGDIIDRGEDSFTCLQDLGKFYKAYPKNVILLAGNHEQFMFTALHNPSPYKRAMAMGNWLRNGTGGRWIWPLLSPNENRLDQFHHFLKSSGLDISSWRSHYIQDQLLFVHAGVIPDLLEEKFEEFFSSPINELPNGDGNSFPNPYWIRNGFLSYEQPLPNYFIFHGHTHTDYTGAPLKGRLNLDGSSQPGIATAFIQPNLLTLELWNQPT